MNKAKPTALVLAFPFEGRIGYFLAGLSHFYKLKVYCTFAGQFQHPRQRFYAWQYASDAEFVDCRSLQQFLSDPATYEAAFLVEESVSALTPLDPEVKLAYQQAKQSGTPLAGDLALAELTGFTKRFANQREIVELLIQVKQKVREIFWLELGEQQYFSCGGEDFWNTVSAVVKGQVFKPAYWHYLRDRQKVSNFQSPILQNFEQLVKENDRMDMGKWNHKIIPFPFTPTVTDKKDLPTGQDKIYDFAANTKTDGNGALRSQVIRAIQNRFENEYSYSIEYFRREWANNVPVSRRGWNPFFIGTARFGELLFKALYGKYFYAMPLYFHNIAKSRCYLGLGWTFSSLRTADCWGVGTVLLNFSFEKCDYGIPVQDGYNYVSVGERDEMTADNTALLPGAENIFLPKVQAILADRGKQKQIVENQLQTYNEYFSSPQRFVQKIFMERTGVCRP